MNLFRLLFGFSVMAFMMLSINASAQSFDLFKKDTINRTDSAGVIQGKWM
jgi:hypothetical protein